MQLWAIFCGIIHLSAGIWAEPVLQDMGVRSATVGENITLRCLCDSQLARYYSWYQQTVGRKPELLSIFAKYEDASEVSHQLDNHPRFSVQMKAGMNLLLISDIQVSDSASYYCGSSYANMVEFADGVLLSVEGSNHQEVEQELPSETIQPGGSATFICRIHTGCCDGEQIVYWFKGHHQRPVHTQRDPCEPASGPQGCVYRLQKDNLSSSDAGTYYCAVASCGEIRFGSGSQLFISSADQAAQVQVFIWLSVIRTGILWAFITICFLICVSERY